MKNITRIVIIVGITCVTLGSYDYVEENSVLRHAVKVVAKIEYTNDESVPVTTQAAIGGPTLSFHHVCHYTVTFNPKNEQAIVTASIAHVENPCLKPGSSMPIAYDSRSPDDSAREENDNTIIHTGVLEIVFGLLLIGAGYLDSRKYNRTHQ